MYVYGKNIWALHMTVCVYHASRALERIPGKNPHPLAVAETTLNRSFSRWGFWLFTKLGVGCEITC